MSDVFLSWGGPDRAAVGRIRERLESVLLDVFEYSRSMDPADKIDDRVHDELRDAPVAIICLSDASIERKWIIRETTLALEHERTGRLKALIPVQVGPLTTEKIRELFDDNRLVFSLVGADGSLDEEQLAKVVSAVFRGLGRPEPVLFPATVLALSDREWHELEATLGKEGVGKLFGAADAWTLLTQLLDGLDAMKRKELEAQLGVGDAARSPEDALRALLEQIALPAVPESLGRMMRDRHGASPLQLKPFASGQEIRDVVLGTVRRFNTSSRRARRPVALRWISHQQLLEKKELRELWRDRPRLLIVDAVALLHPPMQQSFLKIINLAPTTPERLILVCLPPFTRGTDLAVQLAARVFRDTLEAHYAYWRSGDEQKTMSSFDVPSQIGLDRWLVGALGRTHAVAESAFPGSPPDDDNRRAMREAFGAPAPSPKGAWGRHDR